MILSHDKICEENSEACGCDSRYELILMIKDLQNLLSVYYNNLPNWLAREAILDVLDRTDLSRWE